jgi:hypothetical protein
MHILPHLSDKQIVLILTRKGIFDTLSTPNNKIFKDVLALVNQIILTCDSHQHLAGIIVKKFKENHKIDFGVQLIEKCFQHLYVNLIQCSKSWSSLELKSEIKLILSTIRNVLTHISCTLNESFVNEMFDKFLSSSRYMLKTKKKKCSVATLNLIMGIIEKLSTLSYNFRMKEEHYSIMFLWLMESEMPNTALPWLIIGNLTSKKHKFDEFCKNFQLAQSFHLYNILFEKVLNSSILFDCEQASLAILIGNFLEHVADNEQKSFGMTEDRNMIHLTKLFIARKDCKNSADYLIRILIHKNSDEVVEIIKERNLIEQFLVSKDVKCLETIIACYSNNALNELTVSTLINVREKMIMKLMSHIQDPFSAQKEIQRINRSILTIVEIILKSKDGIEKVHFTMCRLNLFTKLAFVIYDGMSLHKSVNLITFYLKFVDSMLNAGKINENVLQFFETNKFTELNNSTKNILSDQKPGVFLEKYFKNAEFIIDLLLLQTINLFNCVDSSAFSDERKYFHNASVTYICR